MNNKSNDAFINYIKKRKSGELVVESIDKEVIPKDFSRSIKNYDISCKEKVNRYQSLMHYIKNKNK